MFALELALLFTAGFAVDALNAAYVRAVTDHARGRAALLSGCANLLWLLVFARIVAYFEPGAAVGNALAYALGNSLGTWTSLRRAGAP